MRRHSLEGGSVLRWLRGARLLKGLKGSKTDSQWGGDELAGWSARLFRVKALAPGPRKLSTPSIDGMQPDFSYHMHGPVAYISYGYGSHFLTNALTMELAASGTRWAVSPEQWAALTGYLLDGSRWVVRGSEYMLSAAGRHNTYFFKPDAFGLAAGHYHFYAAYPLFAAAFPALSLPPFDSPLSVQLVRLLPNFFESRARGSEVRSACGGMHTRTLPCVVRI